MEPEIHKDFKPLLDAIAPLLRKPIVTHAGELLSILRQNCPDWRFK